MTKKLEWQPLWDAMEANPNDWTPTTEKMFWEMLEVLPPRAHNGRAFLVGEALRHNETGHAVHACFRQSGEDYYAKNMTVQQFREITA